MSYNLLAPTIRVEMNAATAPFFDSDPNHPSTLAQAIFELGCVYRRERLFAGRLAPLKANWVPELSWDPHRYAPAGESASDYVIWLPIVREVHRNPDGSLRPGEICLVLFATIDALVLKRGTSPTEQDIFGFWSSNVFMDDFSGRDYYHPYFDQGFDTLARFYYIEPLDAGLVLLNTGACWHIGNEEPQSESQMSATVTNMGVQWMVEAANPDESMAMDGAETLTGLSDQEFCAEVESLLDDPRVELEYALELYCTEEEERCWEVLGCSSQVRCLVQKKCEIEVLQAMSGGGELDGCTSVRCTPWVNEPLSVQSATTVWQPMATPPALEKRFASICSQLGATGPLLAPATDGSPESLRQKVRYDWAARFSFEVKVEAGSAHEIAIAVDSLQQEVEALEAELATTSTT